MEGDFVFDIRFQKEDSAEVAWLLHAADPRRKIAVLSFANGEVPGGQYTAGQGTQEEDLCRRFPFLYPSLLQQVERIGQFGPWVAAMWSETRLNHHLKKRTVGKMRTIGNELRHDENAVLREVATTVIVTPDCLLMRGGEDTGFAPLPSAPNMIVVTAAAPDLNPNHKKDPSGKHSPAGDQRGLLRRLGNPDVRQEALGNVLKGALQWGATHIVIGAWGAGAFNNKAEDIANAWASALTEYGGRFEQISFSQIGMRTEDRKVYEGVLRAAAWGYKA